MAPTLGVVMNRRQTSSCRAQSRTALCSFLNCPSNAALAASMASAICSSIGCPVTSSRDACFEGLIGDLANLQAETPENAAEAELDVPEFVLQLIARNQQGTHLLRSRRFGVNRPEPSHA